MAGFEFSVKFVPHCSACGREVATNNSVYQQEKSYTSSAERHVFIGTCEHCFVFRGTLDHDFTPDLVL